MITCNIPTENFDSGRALLMSADHENDGRIGAVDIVRASQQLAAGEITREEYDFVVQASTEGEIDSYCPETIPGDEDGDYPVTEKDAMAVFKTFAVAAVLTYAVVKIIWG